MRILFAILIISALLRFWALGQNPPSLTWDETAWGYNAYSLGIDLRDEFGRFLPYDYLESFGDFKPPLYAYLDIFSVKIFGLTEFAVRFPSALFGVLTVLVTYFLTKRIFYKSNLANQYGLAAALILGISHWHIMLSRAAFEANVATFFIVLGVYLFLFSVQNRPRYLVLSLISFVLSIYTFNTARIVSPLIVLFLVVCFRNKLWVFKKEFLIASVVALLLVLPILKFLLSPQAALRFKEVNIFSDAGPIQVSNEQISNDNNALWSKIIHNRRLVYGVEYLKHYFDNLNPSFLFIKGDGNPKFSIQEVGQMYLWDLPFFIMGAFLIFRRKEGYWWIIPVWLLLSIMPAATARETPHALRIEAGLPTFQIITAYGFINFINSLKKHKSKITYLLYFLLFLNVLYFLHGYTSHYAKEFSGEWQYGYKESINYVKQVENEYDQINVTEELGRPYIYYLFYNKKNPKDFRKDVFIEREALGFVNVTGFGKYRFGKDLGKIETTGKTLYINTPGKVPASANKLKTFYLLNKEEVLVAYTL